MRFLIALMLAAASLAAANTIQPPAQYPCDPDEAVANFLFARQALTALPYTPEVEAPRPSAFPGRSLELKARLRGRIVINADDPARRRTCLRLELANHQPLVVISCAEVKGIQEGDRVRVIVEAPAQQSGAATFELRAIVLEADLPAETPAAEAAAPALAPQSGAAPPAQPVPPPTRGGEVRPPDLAPFQVALPLQPKTGKAGMWDSVGGIGYPVVEPARLQPWLRFIHNCNRDLSQEQADWIARWVIYYSARCGVDHRLIFAMIKCESDFDPNCVSHAGAVGLTQLMPCNLEDFHVGNKWNVQEQIRAGVEHFKEMLDMWKGRDNYEQFALAAASFNAGPNRVKRDGGIPNITETRNYVKRLGDLFYRLWKEGYP